MNNLFVTRNCTGTFFQTRTFAGKNSIMNVCFLIKEGEQVHPALKTERLFFTRKHFNDIYVEACREGVVRGGSVWANGGCSGAAVGLLWKSDFPERWSTIHAR